MGAFEKSTERNLGCTELIENAECTRLMKAASSFLKTKWPHIRPCEYGEGAVFDDRVGPDPTAALIGYQRWITDHQAPLLIKNREYPEARRRLERVGGVLVGAGLISMREADSIDRPSNAKN